MQALVCHRTFLPWEDEPVLIAQKPIGCRNPDLLGPQSFLWMRDIYWWSDHDDVIKWKHFPRYWPFVRGIHWSPVTSPHQGQWRGDLKFSLICVWINDWVNNREACDLWRHRGHYNVTVMAFNTRNEMPPDWDLTRSRQPYCVRSSCAKMTFKITEISQGNMCKFVARCVPVDGLAPFSAMAWPYICDTGGLSYQHWLT